MTVAVAANTHVKLRVLEELADSGEVPFYNSLENVTHLRRKGRMKEERKEGRRRKSDEKKKKKKVNKKKKRKAKEKETEIL